MSARRLSPRHSLRSVAPTPREAVALQRVLAPRVERRWRPVRPAARGASARLPELSTVAGADVSVRAERVRAVAVVLSFPGLEVLETRQAERPLAFPYVPGLLSFREIPVLLDAFDRLSLRPDVVLVDGHGIAHPRRIGLASHLGLELDLPTIGCAKTLFVGTHREPGVRRRARTRLMHRGERIGTCLRTRDGVRPIFVSIGHRVDLPRAERIALSCARRYRLPLPTHLADRLAGQWG